ncbi:endonuclease-reverse transcriptase [Plakobranchus ocellatus]|uniref:Endonuclease-reverse transcriptase n=1 Tax=Plakobranchus ocellatus TaxID=259542 RepID=A0AAV3YKF6_9GAST|nr:endonuclease-reverse transcriptase [Plakobranchus ocellatus]
MTYGAEDGHSEKRDRKKIESVEMWCYKRFLRISWKEKKLTKASSNNLTYHDQSWTGYRKEKLSFLGQASRRKCSLMKDIIQGKLEGKRGRGRPQQAILKYEKLYEKDFLMYFIIF